MSAYPALIVEDDAFQREIFVKAVEAAGFAPVDMAADGREALTYLQRHTPALVVLDLHLPVALGDDILAYLRREPRFAATRVILATGNPHMADPLQNESDLVLLKPVSFTQLRDLAMRLRRAIATERGDPCPE
ncbi:MAG: response regulator [Chloroflexi bacterium]|nr:response regulator [Chloroflexota bacterium]